MLPATVSANVLAKGLHAMGWQCRAAKEVFSNTVKDPCPSCADSARTLITGLRAAGFTIAAGGRRQTSSHATDTLARIMHEQSGWNDLHPYLGPPYHDACEGWAATVIEFLGQAGFVIRARS